MTEETPEKPASGSAAAPAPAAPAAPVQKTFVNIGEYTRSWFDLVRLEDKLDADGNIVIPAGATLELDPGESALISVDPNFSDPWLQEAKVGAAKSGKK